MKKYLSVRGLMEAVTQYRIKHISVTVGEENLLFLKEQKIVIAKYDVQRGYGLFNSCWFLETIDLRDFDFTYVNNMEAWFEDCTRLKTVDFPKKVNATNITSLKKCFARSGIVFVDFSGWEFGKNTILYGMCNHCPNLTTIILPLIYTANLSKIATSSKQLEKVVLPITVDSFTFEESWFEDCVNLKMVDLSRAKFNEKNVLEYFNKNNIFANVSEDCLIILP